jgi:sorbitol-6-phosphate 2-dehydrogenase
MGMLEGKVALVTGGGRGLGEALSKRLAAEGCKVAVTDVILNSAETVAAALPDGLGIACDVSDYVQCEAAFERTIEKFGKLDILVANAGILISGAINEIDVSAWKKVIDVNLLGSFHIMKACSQHFIDRRSGCIIQINSKSGKKGSYKSSAYASSKFGGIGLVQSLALELAPHGVRVNAICPGNLLNSPLWREGDNSLAKQYARNRGQSVDETLAQYLKQIPMGRSCEYDDVANVMVFLASDLSSYMTGQAINVTGGFEMR